MNYLLYIGIHSQDEKGGIDLWNFNSGTNTLVPCKHLNSVKNISYMCLSSDNQYLFVASEQSGEGYITVFHIQFGIKDLTEVVKFSYKQCSFSHLQINLTGNLLFASCYGTGEVLVLQFDSFNQTLRLIDKLIFTGSGPNLERQLSSHPHSVYFSPRQNIAVVSDLGSDAVNILSIDCQTVRVANQWQSYPGSGPRHFAFHPNGQWAYLLTELSSEIIAFHYTGAEFDPIQRISVVPSGYCGDNLSADILVSKDGTKLYASNRGSNNIACYSIDADGYLCLDQYIPTRGWARALYLSNHDEFLFVLNEEFSDSKGEIEIFPLKQGVPQSNGIVRSCPFAYTFCAME
ncbi:6-phosphogluconolactonase [uncultured Ruminococcus sp.]|nr:6-phosphogluconolactonase [uncultured Clostridium sp.]SCI45755.1 6-phosphogluconolactonase [uncultured Ruminococcus sp.]